MISLVKYLVYIMSFFIPTVGVIAFWVFLGRVKEPNPIAKWSFPATFIGSVVWVIVSAVGITTHRIFWQSMGRW